MSIYDSQVVVYVTYQGTPEDRFDREHYNNVHLPLVMRSWGKYGLLNVAAFYPAVEETGTVAVCECIFRDEAAMEVVFSSPEVPKVMADVPIFTDLTPVRVRAQRL